jgi:hypothetical protein
MLSHVIIKLVGISRYAHPRAAGKFLYTPKYNGYVWLGRALTLEELNHEKSHAIESFDRQSPYFPTVEAVVSEVEDSLPLTSQHRGHGKYSVYDSAGLEVAKNVTKQKANELIATN